MAAALALSSLRSLLARPASAEPVLGSPRSLGLASFMALHLLQPPNRRRVLVMDDRVSVFDSANQTGFLSSPSLTAAPPVSADKATIEALTIPLPA